MSLMLCCTLRRVPSCWPKVPLGFPPLVLLAATHSIAVLVCTRAGGLTYWCALLMTPALASCAFVLSFDASRSLVVFLGLPEAIAWLWPCAIDVAISQATLCLLSLSRRDPHRVKQFCGGVASRGLVNVEASTRAVRFSTRCGTARSRSRRVAVSGTLPNVHTDISPLSVKIKAGVRLLTTDILSF
jgi:Protein of unknown function (DUF2637)